MHPTRKRCLPRHANIRNVRPVKKFTDEARQSQTELGLPAEPVFDWQMSFLPASRTLLLRFSTIGSGIRVPRLFLRREGSNRYVDILDVAEPALASQARAKDREVFLGA